MHSETPNLTPTRRPNHGFLPRPQVQYLDPTTRGSREGRMPASHSSGTAQPPRRAKILTDRNVDELLRHIARFDNAPLSGEVKLLLSVYAGLRVAEIASLTLDAVTEPDGSIGQFLVVRARYAKNRRERTIPLNPRLREALIRFSRTHPGLEYFAYSRRWYTIKRQRTDAVKHWFSQLYRTTGLKGCSSHSGRRTFITRLARMANQHNASLRDVQMLAGHSRLDTTATYIETSDNVRSLVAALKFEEEPTARVGMTAARGGR